MKNKSPIILVFLALILIGAFLYLRTPKKSAQILPFPKLGQKQPTVSRPSVTQPSVSVKAATYFAWPFDFPRTNIQENDKVLNLLTGDFA